MKPASQIASKAQEPLRWHRSAGEWEAPPAISNPPRFRGKPRPTAHLSPTVPCREGGRRPCRLAPRPDCDQNLCHSSLRLQPLVSGRSWTGESRFSGRPRSVIDEGLACLDPRQPVAGVLPKFPHPDRIHVRHGGTWAVLQESPLMINVLRSASARIHYRLGAEHQTPSELVGHPRPQRLRPCPAYKASRASHGT